MQSGDAVASATGDGAVLSNGYVRREWAIGEGTETVRLLDAESGAAMAGRAPDFTLTVDGVRLTSESGWQVSAEVRPAPGPGVELRFAYTAPVLPGVTVRRAYILRPRSHVIRVHSTLENAGPAPLRVAFYTLDEVASAQRKPIEVHAYHGGSDWRDDYRVVTRPEGDFDAEGQLLRTGTDSGWFIVSQRRSGAMSRVGRTGDRGWAGVDSSRDLFDFGPLKSDPPDYNRLENPVPLVARDRTVRPGDTLELGTAHTGIYARGAHRGPQAFARHFAPRYANTVSLSTWHPWRRDEGMSDRNLRAQVDLAKRLGIERIMLDDQWQGGPEGESGDWRFDPERFPDADGDDVPDLVEYVHDAGLELGLWLTPLEFNARSRAYAEHPEWVCTPIGQAAAQIPDEAGFGVWDVTNASFREYIRGVIARLVRDYDVREFKFDFMTWADCPPRDYNDYEDAFVALLREFRRAHPDVTFQLDETNDQRLWAFRSAAYGPTWFDNGHLHGSTAPAKFLHDLWSAAPWLPTAGIGFGTYDESALKPPYTPGYLMPLALLGHVTFWTDLTKLSPRAFAETRWWIRWYRRNRDALSRLVWTNTTADPIDGKSWVAFQPWRAGRGYLFAFRQSGGPARRRIPLFGLRRNGRYVVRNVRTGKVVARATGARLTRGLAVALPRPFRAVVLSIERRHAQG